MDPGKIKFRAGKKDAHKDAGHEAAFKPAKDTNKRVVLGYDHMTNLKETKKTYRDPEGAVIIAPHNFLNNPMKRGAAASTPG